MVDINETTNEIKMTRGDTLRATLRLVDREGNEYVPVAGDKIRFAMKKEYDDPNPIILREIPTDTLALVIYPEDTKDLPQPSKYVYDIEITYANGDVDTFIDKAKLKLTEEVH